MDTVSYPPRMSVIEDRPATEPPAADRPVEDHHVAIVGAGFGGIGAAIRLAEAGIDDVVVLERNEALGGTWRANTYPGCACDVPSQLYSFSFAPNPDWSRFYAPQPEILAYLERTARERGVEGKIRFGATLQDAAWEADIQRWRVRTSAGELTARALISAAGPLSEPGRPDIPGLDSFAGTMFHSAEWDHEHDLTDERVAVLGTGASAAQFIPHVQRAAGHLDVYQRTAGWIMPRNDLEVSPRARKLLRRFPLVQKAIRTFIYYMAELLVVGLVHEKRLLNLFEAIARKKLKTAVPDPVLREKLTPTFRLGCKRIIFSDDYLPALAKPDVELVTDPIKEVTPEGVVTADGTLRPVDTIILGTGFKVWDSPAAKVIRGADGVSLHESWEDGGPQAFLGTVVAGFPNFFFLIGPNTGLGNNSMINIIEAQVDLLVKALTDMQHAGIGAIDVPRAKQDAYNDEIQQQMVGTVWTEGGCKSWYLGADGTNRTLWPSFSDAFKRRLKSFSLADFEQEPKRAREGAPA